MIRPHRRDKTVMVEKNRKTQKYIKQAISETFAEQMKVRKEDIEEELKHYDIKGA